jgi:hypothetical protein
LFNIKKEWPSPPHPSSFLCVFVRVFPFEITEAVQHKRVCMVSSFDNQNRFGYLPSSPIWWDSSAQGGLPLIQQLPLGGLCFFGFPVYSPHHDQKKRRIQPSKSNFFFFSFLVYYYLFFFCYQTFSENNRINGFSHSIFPPFVYVWLGLFRGIVRSFAVYFLRYWLPIQKRVPLRPVPRSNRKPISWLKLSWSVHHIISGRTTKVVFILAANQK